MALKVEPTERANRPGPALLCLPPELLSNVCSHLDNTDIKTLRLTCALASDAVPLRLERVFLSPNPLNISVFRAVADHPVLRLAVREIVYDDARLPDPYSRADRLNDCHPNDNIDDLEPDAEDLWVGEGLRLAAREGAARAWFSDRRERNLKDLDNELWRLQVVGEEVPIDVVDEINKKRAAQPPFEPTFQRYLELLREQAGVIDTDADAQALAYGLDRFPRLERVTVTPAAHGFLHMPIYPTPMIRSLSYGSNYVLPRGWPTSRAELRRMTQPWVPGGDYSQEEAEAQRAKWRGVTLVLKLLADRIRGQPAAGGAGPVPELVFDVGRFRTGLNPFMLAQPCAEHDDLALLLRQPGFRRLALSVNTTGLKHRGWGPLSGGSLRALLAGAAGLEDLALTGSGDATEVSHLAHVVCAAPLPAMLPLDRWTRLRRLRVAMLTIATPDWITLLAALPRTIRRVEMGGLMFLSVRPPRVCDAQDYVLRQMKARLDWKNWPPDARPVVVVDSDERIRVKENGVFVDVPLFSMLYRDLPPDPYDSN